MCSSFAHCLMMAWLSHSWHPRFALAQNCRFCVRAILGPRSCPAFIPE